MSDLSLPSLERVRRVEPRLADAVQQDVDRLLRASEAMAWAQRALPALLAASTERAVLQVVVDRAREETGVPLVWAVAWKGRPLADGASVRALVGTPGDVEPGDLFDPRQVSKTVVGRVIEEGRPAWTDDATADARFEAAQSVAAYGLRSVGCVPLGRSGVLYLLDPEQPGRFSPPPRARLSALGRVAAAFLDRERTEAPTGSEPLPGVVGASRSMKELADTARAFARVPWPALVLGESGTGKEAVARALHQLSPRASEPFRALNCGAITESLAESTLFGHERGAFTGADRVRVGLLEEVGEGTLFLDEVGELPAGVQTKLLRVLQEGVYSRVGDSRERTFRGRVVAATWRELVDGEAGFRADLYHRLASCVLRVPSLRERRSDVPALATHLLERSAAELGLDKVVLAPDALHLLAGNTWHGNVRELQNTLRGALARAVGAGTTTVEVEHVAAQLRASRGELAPPEPVTDTLRVAIDEALARSHPGLAPVTVQEMAEAEAEARSGFPPELDPAGVTDLGAATDRYQQLVIEAALERNDGNRSAAARELGVTRQWLHRLIKRWEDA